MPPAARLTTATALALLLAGPALLRAGAAEAAPRVVATIKPVHSLAAGVMAGVGAPHLLIRGAASPHAYALRPSDARALRRAERIFWVGEQIEPFLAKPLAALGGGRAVALSRAAGLVLFPARAGGTWEGHESEHGEHEGENHEQAEEKHAHKQERERHHGDHDMHVWLSPANARAMARAIARSLGEADPANAARYRANAERLGERIAALDGELRALLRPVAARPFIVFHDAYQYFEKHYGLNGAGAVAVAPERRPGARRLHEIRERIARSRVACVFAEPQFAPKLVRTVVRGTRARTGVLDPLGADLPAGPEMYFALMRRLAASFRGCLLPR